MIPQHFRNDQEETVAVPFDVQRLFTMYEQEKMGEADLIHLLRGELDLHPNFVPEVRGKILNVIETLQRDLDAREMCKSETGIAAVPTQRERKIQW